MGGIRGERSIGFTVVNIKVTSSMSTDYNFWQTSGGRKTGKKGVTISFIHRLNASGKGRTENATGARNRKHSQSGVWVTTGRTLTLKAAAGVSALLKRAVGGKKKKRGGDRRRGSRKKNHNRGIVKEETSHGGKKKRKRMTTGTVHTCTENANPQKNKKRGERETDVAP